MKKQIYQPNSKTLLYNQLLQIKVIKSHLSILKGNKFVFEEQINVDSFA